MWHQISAIGSRDPGHRCAASPVALRYAAAFLALVVGAGAAEQPDIVWRASGLVGNVNSVTFSPDGQTLASGGDDVRLWQVWDGTLLRTLPGSAVSPVAFSPDGLTLASGGNDWSVKLWQVSDGTLVRTLKREHYYDPVYSLVWAPDGQTLAVASAVTAGFDSWGYVPIWRVSNGTMAHVLSPEGPTHAVAFSPDGLTVATGDSYWVHERSNFSKGHVALWQLSGWPLLWEHEQQGSVYALAFAPDGRTLASGSTCGNATPPYPGQAFLWRSDSLPLGTLGSDSAGALSVAFTPDSQTLAQTGRDAIQFWRVSDRTLRGVYNEEIGTGAHAISFSPDGRLFAYGRSDSTLVVARTPYTIMGHVAKAAGAGVAGVHFSGRPGEHTSLADGSYALLVPPGFNGVLTPEKAGYLFTPPSRTYSDVQAEQLGEDYVATVQTFTISGTIAENSGAGVAEVVIVGLPGDPLTQADGSYTATVEYGFSGTVTPAKAGYVFDPISRTYADVTGTQADQNYLARRVHTIVGRVTDAAGTGLSGVVLNGLPGSPATQADGSYSSTVARGFGSTVTPRLAGYTFEPPSRTYRNVTSDQTNQDYAAAVQMLAISGRVTAADGAGVADVVLNGLPGDPATQADGRYTATVEYGFSGTATPAKAGLSFEPPSREYSSVAADQTGQDYGASVVPAPPDGGGDQTGTDETNNDATPNVEPNAPTTPEVVVPTQLCPLAAAGLLAGILLGLLRARDPRSK